MPPQTYASAMPLADLRTAELLLVTTLRLFAASWRGCGVCDWRDGLSAAGLDETVAEEFSNLFGIVAAAPRRKLDVGWPHCPLVSPDEGRLLQLMGALQRRRHDDADAILGDWLAPAAARLAVAPALSVALGFNRQGLLIPPRHRADRLFGDSRNPQFGAALLH